MNDISPPADRTSGMRTILAAASMALPLVAIVLTYALWAPGLPEEVASHWSGTGAPDDSLPTVNVFIGALILSSAALIATIVLLAIRKPAIQPQRMIVFLLGLVGGLAAGVWIIPTWLTMQAGSVEGAELGFWAIPLGIGSLYGIVPAAILPARQTPFDRDTVTASLDLGETEIGAWSRTISANIFLWVTIGMGVLLTVVYIPVFLIEDPLSAGIETAVAVFAVLAVLVCASFIRLRVSIDWRGLRVVSLFGIPLKRIALDQVSAVEAAEIRPMDWGGWGYRIMPGRSAVVLRTGPGLVVTTTSDKLFAITLDDPEGPAALLQTLAARSRANA